MLKVLVVDDDIDLLEMVSTVLTNQQMTVNSITKGNLLFDTITGNKPDIILMDIYLGECDGRDLCLQLKKSNQFEDIPVILYSAGHIAPSTIQTSGADDFISKPFDISQLVKRINAQVKDLY